MHWLVVLWMVAPSFYPARFYIHWMDIVAPIGIGAVWLGAFLILESALIAAAS
jgi:hypothetical protein